jgi:hypothetical protein
MSSVKHRIQVPVGVEKLLYLAAGDARFKVSLLANGGAAIEEAGVRLRPSEAAALAAIDRTALLAMIEAIVPSNPRRRKFMGLVAAAATSLAAGTAVVCCDGASGDVLTKGSTGDTDVDGDTDGDADAGDDAGDTDTVDTETDTESSFGLTADARVDGRFGEEE